MNEPEPTSGPSPDPLMQALLEDIADAGWSVQLVPAGEDESQEPPYAYTVGLFKSFGHAELIVFGLPFETMEELLDLCAERVAEGGTLAQGTPFHGVLEKFALLARAVKDPQSYEAHVGYAIAFHGGTNFPLLQLLWPDKKGKFPGQPAAAPALAKHQPLLP